MGTTTATRRPAGTVLDGRYELVSLLGRGGMAEVYEAADRRLGRRVAVKMLREDLADDRRLLARFRREARAAAALSHPHIAAVHDSGSHDGVPYIVMEHVEGRTLAAVLGEEGPLPFARAAEIGVAVAGALACAHAAGIVHRDLKPGNVMVTADGDVKVVDFGIAWATRWTPLDDVARAQGTAEYLSPEQARGEELDGRSDLYSLGVVLYELLTGQPPFFGDNAVAVAYRHVEDPPAPVGAHRAGIPAALSDIVMWCLAKSRRDRPASADELRDHLVRFLTAEPATTAPLSRLGTTRPLPVWWRTDDPPSPPRRSGRWVVPVLVAVTLAAAGTGILWAQTADPSKPRPPALRPPQAVVADGACDGFLQARVTLRWTATNAGSVDGYEIFRSTATGGPYERAGTVVDGSATSFVDRGLDPAATYFYVVKATKGLRASPLSAQAQAATPFACLW